MSHLRCLIKHQWCRHHVWTKDEFGVWNRWVYRRCLRCRRADGPPRLMDTTKDVEDVMLDHVLGRSSIG